MITNQNSYSGGIAKMATDLFSNIAILFLFICILMENDKENNKIPSQ